MREQPEMSTSAGVPPGRESYVGAFLRGLIGAVVLALAIGVAIALGELAESNLGFGTTARQVVHAVVTSCIAVPAVLLLRRGEGRPLAGLGLLSLRGSLVTFGLGFAVTVAAAAALFGPATAVGWVRWGPVQVATLVGYLALTAPIALLYEALPEELALRGFTYTSLAARLRRWTATLATTVLFLLVPGAANAVHAGLRWLVTQEAQALRVAPEGEDPVAYLVLLTIFGIVLVVARVTTDSLWTPIGLHLTFLLVNRVTLFGDPDVTGWSAELTHPDAILIVPGYLVVAAVTLVVLARVRGRRSGWRESVPQPGRAS